MRGRGNLFRPNQFNLSSIIRISRPTFCTEERAYGLILKTLGACLDPKPVCHVLAVGRQALKCVKYACRNRDDCAGLKSRIKSADRLLFTLQFGIGLCKVPKNIKTIIKTSRAIVKDVHGVVEGEVSLNATFFLKNTTRGTLVIEKSIGVVIKLVYKPVKCASLYVDLGASAKVMGRQCKILSIIAKSVKICYSIECIVQGKKWEKRSFKLVFFQIPFLIFDILELANVEAHPAIRLSFGTVKIFFEIVWDLEKLAHQNNLVGENGDGW